MRMHRTLALGAASLALIVSACTPGEGGSPSSEASQAANLPDISIGSAGFPEAAVVAELGERDAVRAAIDGGDINLYPDYLGGLAGFLELVPTSDADATQADIATALEPLGQTILDFSPGTDADGFAVRQETATDLGVVPPRTA